MVEPRRMVERSYRIMTRALAGAETTGKARKPARQAKSAKEGVEK
jgi:hypothetical protein